MYEQERRSPSIEILCALSREFNVTIDYLITESYDVNLDHRISVSNKHLTEEMPKLWNLSREDMLILMIAQMQQICTGLSYDCKSIFL